MTDSLKVGDILRKRSIFYWDDFLLGGKFSGVGVDFSAETLHGENLAGFKYKFAHSPHEKLSMNDYLLELSTRNLSMEGRDLGKVFNIEGIFGMN